MGKRGDGSRVSELINKQESLKC